MRTFFLALLLSMLFHSVWAQQNSDTPTSESIGIATMDVDQTVTLYLRRTGDGDHAMATFNYKVGDKDYEMITKHLGGIAPGETKLVKPFRK